MDNDTPVETEREYTPVEQEAISQGWVPKDDFEGDPDRYIDAPEFVRRGELFGKIEQQSKTLKQQAKAIEALALHNSKVEKAAYTRARQELLAEKKTALAEGDVDKVVEIDERLDFVKEQQKTIDATRVKAIEEEVIHPEMQQWQQKNTWYGTTRAMTLWADERGIELSHSGKTPKQVLDQIEQEVKKEFPSKFTNPNREKVGAVEGGSTRVTASGKQSDVNLTDDERSIMNTILRVTPGLSKEKYLADLKKIKETK